MFGYIKPFQPELRVKELDAYRAVYCGLCGQLGRSFGPVARLTLSYDFTFLSMLHCSVRGETPQLAMRRCPFSPVSRRRPMWVGGPALELGADMAAIMIYYKLLDNIHDGGIFTKLGCTVLRPLAAHARNRAAGCRHAGDVLVADAMARQAELENARTGSLDAACEPTATMLGGMFGLLSEQDNQRRVLRRFGYLMGRFIYLCDALDDLRQDVRSGGYNPIVLVHDLAGGGDWAAARDSVTQSLYMTIGETEKTLALLPLHDFAPIIQNIVSLGLRASVDEILRRAKTPGDRSSV